jgi:hypothetical protein
VISGIVEDNYYNLMVFDADAEVLADWISENTGKVEIITKEQADALGQSIVPLDTERVEKSMEGEKEKVYIAGSFDAENPGALWIFVEERDILV